MSAFTACVGHIKGEIGGQRLLNGKPPLGYIRVFAIALFRVG